VGLNMALAASTNAPISVKRRIARADKTRLIASIISINAVDFSGVLTGGGASGGSGMVRGGT